MAYYKVLLTEAIDEVGLELLRSEADILVAARPTLEEIARLAPSADAFVVRGGPCPREVIASAPNLKVIGKHGVGLDNIDVAAASERGIPVFNTPGANSEAVAELAFAMMLALARQLRLLQRLTETGRSSEARCRVQATQLQGKTLGLVGLGHIGSLLAGKCICAFGMRVVAYDPYVVGSPIIAGTAVEMATSLDQVLEQADFVSVHAPLTAETRGLIGAHALAKMKRTAFLINTARGAIVDEQALAQALRGGVIAGAGLDVFAHEPIPPDHPLIGLENVVLTPHVGGQTPEAGRAIALAVARGVLAALHGERPADVVNPDVYAARRRGC
ncbi:MAG: hydroxyacid dehydrogenase [Anaerolineae bacterium]|nr:hydroxyacid dehydrogenase [Anaerolineae bacterium]